MDRASHHHWLSAHKQSQQHSEPVCFSPQRVITANICSPVSHLEQVERGVKHLLYYLFQKLFEDAVLINTSLIDTQIIHKLHSDHSLHGILGKLP